MNITVLFRFLTLDKFQAITLSRELSGANYQPAAQSTGFIGQVAIDESLENVDDLMAFYVRQQISLAHCDIQISVSSPQKVGSVTIPSFVNKLLKHIDCSLTFSFEVE